ncbi:MAG: polymer-forming cytoskeletal protein [Cyanothece sp. SIO1E1]|nr:polymer-forming cytoskeletal protein [Cyanothece sp. SIO1E1]
MFKRKPTPLLTYLSRTSEFQGSIQAEGLLRIDGIVHGTVEVQGDMEISTTGLVEGPEVKARNLVIHGVLKARVSVEEKLTLTRTARLEGDVVAGSLEVEAGALYSGYIETRDMKNLPPSREIPELYGTVEEAG